MHITTDTLQKVRALAETAYTIIGTRNLQKSIDMTAKFVISQPPVEFVLDGKTTFGITVDIATVYTPDINYHLYTDENGTVHRVEAIQALSIVIIGEEVLLCKSTYDVLPGPTYEASKFINALYQTTDPSQLTETYIC